MDSSKKIRLECETPTMDILPDEVLVEILAKLEYFDLCMCSQVCRRWYDLTQSSRLKKSITIKKFLSARQLRKLVQWHFHEVLETFELECKRFDRVYVSKQTLREMQEKSPNLKKLVFKWCSLYPSAIDDMSLKIQHLSLRECTVHGHIKLDIHRESHLHMEIHKERLTCLDMTGRDVILPLKFFYVSKLKNLRWLYLEHCGNMTNKRIRSMADILPQLYALDVEGNMIRNGGVRIILERCTEIKELYIGRLYVDDGSLFNCSVDKLPNLTTLCIAGTYITRYGLHRFMQSSTREISVLGLDKVFDGPIPTLLDCRRYNFSGCNH